MTDSRAPNPWQNRLPSWWQSIPLKRLTTHISRGNTPDYVEDGPTRVLSQACVQWSGIGPEASRYHASAEIAGAKGELQPNDVVINSTGTGTLGRIQLFNLQGKWMADGHVTVVRCDSNRLYPRFLRYMLSAWPVQSYIYAALIVGATNQIELNVARLRAMSVPVPPLSEQRAIADYLDREIARIDALVNRQQRLIDLIGDRAVAGSESFLLAGDPLQYGRALNRVRDTAVPEGWTARPCRWLFREIDERSTTGAEMMLAVSKSVGVVPRDQWTDREPRADTLEGYKLVQPGDIVINRMRAFNGALGVSSWHGIVSPDYAVLRPGALVDCRYYAHLLRTPTFVGEMRRRLRGIGGIDMGAVRTPRINMSDLGQIVLPVPPLDVQHRLADRADKAIAQSRNLIRSLEEAIGLFQERRRALITAAVTGQLDISQVAT